MPLRRANQHVQHWLNQRLLAFSFFFWSSSKVHMLQVSAKTTVYVRMRSPLPGLSTPSPSLVIQTVSSNSFMVTCYYSTTDSTNRRRMNAFFVLVHLYPKARPQLSSKCYRWVLRRSRERRNFFATDPTNFHQCILVTIHGVMTRHEQSQRDQQLPYVTMKDIPYLEGDTQRNEEKVSTAR